MPDLGTVAYLIAISYGMGVLWYTVLGRNYTSWMRMAAFPLLGMIIGEALWINHLSSSADQGLVFLGIHIYVALAATFIGALVDVGASWMANEHPSRMSSKASTTNSTLPSGNRHHGDPTLGHVRRTLHCKVLLFFF